MFSFIAAEKVNYPVAVMCRMFAVNRTSFHDWERRAPSDPALTDAFLSEKIKQIHEDNRGCMGLPESMPSCAWSTTSGSGESASRG